MVFIYIKIDGLMNVKDTGRNEKEEDHMPYVEIQDLEMYYEKWVQLRGNVALYCAVKHPQMFATVTTIGCSGVACPEGADEFDYASERTGLAPISAIDT